MRRMPMIYGACNKLRTGRWTNKCLLLLALSLTSVTLACIAPAAADQNDPRLDSLFKSLQAADAVNGSVIEANIWAIWSATADETSSRLLDQGITLMSLRRWREALDRFDLLVNRSPAFAEGWNKRATGYFLLGDLEHSVQDIERTLALEPRHFGALSGLGQIYLRRDQPDAALRVLEAALKINPSMVVLKRQVDELRAQL